MFENFPTQAHIYRWRIISIVGLVLFAVLHIQAAYLSLVGSFMFFGILLTILTVIEAYVVKKQFGFTSKIDYIMFIVIPLFGIITLGNFGGFVVVTVISYSRLLKF